MKTIITESNNEEFPKKYEYDVTFANKYLAVMEDHVLRILAATDEAENTNIRNSLDDSNSHHPLVTATYDSLIDEGLALKTFSQKDIDELKSLLDKTDGGDETILRRFLMQKNDGQYNIELFFSPEGRKKLKEISGKNMYAA